MQSVAEILKANKGLKLLPSNRILCKVTGHEMPARADVLLSHLNGKKYKKAKEAKGVDTKYDFSEFLPYVVEDNEDSTKLYCTLTGESLHKIPAVVKKHVSGKRFLRLKQEKESAEAKKKEMNDEEENTDGIWKYDSDDEEESNIDETEDVDNLDDLMGSGHDDINDNLAHESKLTKSKNGKELKQQKNTKGGGKSKEEAVEKPLKKSTKTGTEGKATNGKRKAEVEAIEPAVTTEKKSKKQKAKN